MNEDSSPLEPFKRATTATMRALAENDELEVSFGKGAVSVRGNSVQVPLPNIGCTEQELNASRIAMVGAILLAGYFGLNPPDFAAGTVAIAFGLAASSIFPVLMMGIFVKRMNREGAIAGMIAGLGVTLLYVFQHKGIMFIPGTSYMGGMEDNWFFGITPNAFGAVGAIVNFVVAFIVSKMAKDPPEEVQNLVEDIRLPQINEN